MKKQHNSIWIHRLSILLLAAFAYSGNAFGQANYLSMYGNNAIGCFPNSYRLTGTKPISSSTGLNLINNITAATDVFCRNSVYNKNGNLLFTATTSGIYDASGVLIWDIKDNDSVGYTSGGSGVNSIAYYGPCTSGTLTNTLPASSEMVIIPNRSKCNSYYVFFWVGLRFGTTTGGIAQNFAFEALEVDVDVSGHLSFTPYLLYEDCSTPYVHNPIGLYAFQVVADNERSDLSRDIYTLSPESNGGTITHRLRKWTISSTGLLPSSSTLIYPTSGTGSTPLPFSYLTKAKILTMPSLSGFGYDKYLCYVFVPSMSTAGSCPKLQTIDLSTSTPTLSSVYTCPLVSPTLSVIDHPTTSTPNKQSIFGFEYLPNVNRMYFSYRDGSFEDIAMHTVPYGGLGYALPPATSTNYTITPITPTSYNYLYSDLELTKQGDLILGYTDIAPAYPYFPLMSSAFNTRLAYLPTSTISSVPALAATAPTVITTSTCSTYSYIPIWSLDLFSFSTAGYGGLYFGSQIRGENYDTWSYDVVNYTVSGSETWGPSSNPITNATGINTSVITIEGDLTIPKGTSLNLQNMTLKFGRNAHVRVGAEHGSAATLGGKLTLENTILTNNSTGCDNIGRWGGVILEGNPTLPQLTFSTSQQGALYMWQNSIISNAVTGVLSGAAAVHPASWWWYCDRNIGGGLLNINNSTMLNNITGVKIYRYTNFNPSNPGVEISNASGFIWSSFILNNSAVLSDASAISASPTGIYGEGIKGLSIRGCNFQNNTGTFGDTYGIFGNDMGFIVDKHHTYSYGDIPSTFNNLTTAIKHTSMATANTPVIRNSVFNNNYIGVNLEGSLAPVVAYNTFNINPWGTSYPTTYGNKCIGVMLWTADAFIVNSNTFQNPSTSYCSNIGVLAWNTGGGDNKVNNNTYTFMGTGNLGNFKNTNGTSGGAAHGLLFSCNTHSMNYIDMAARGASYLTDGIKAVQGDLGAGQTCANIFSADWGSTYNIYNPGQHTTAYPNNEVGELTYVYSNYASATERPGQPSGSTANNYGAGWDCNVVGINAYDYCTPSIGGSPIAMDGSHLINIAGNSNFTTDQQMHAAINNVAYYLSDELAISDRASLYYWAKQIHSPGGDKLLARLYLEDSLVDSANAVYDSIIYHYDLDSFEKAQYSGGGRQLMDIQLNMMAAYSQTELSSNQKAALQTAYNSSASWVRGLCRSWINNFATELFDSGFIFTDSVLYPVLPDSLVSPRIANGNNGFEFKGSFVYPNPVSNILQVQYEPKIGKTAVIQLEDVTGRQIISKQLQEKTTNIDVNMLVPGIYIYKIIEEGMQVHKGKIIKN